MDRMKRKIPTLEDRAKANRLKQIWVERKIELKLTQVSAAKALGMTQPSFSQYLNGVIPLNTDIVLKFSDLLRVSPVKIDPALKNVNSLMNLRREQFKTISVPLIGSISGKSVLGKSAVHIEGLPPEGVYVGIAVDSSSLKKAGIPQGSTIIADLDQEPCTRQRNVVISQRGKDSYQFSLFLDDSGSSYRLRDAVTNKEFSLRHNLVLAMHLVQTVAVP